MMSFSEYAAWRQRTSLPDAHTMLIKAGIDPHGPHQIEVMRLTKVMKKVASPRSNRKATEVTSCLRPSDRSS